MEKMKIRKKEDKRRENLKSSGSAENSFEWFNYKGATTYLDNPQN
jgi:hypothetical protein